jgi:hypothetical protein
LSGVTRAPLPSEALLAHYRDKGAYTDCYALDVSKVVSRADYVCAFYTSWLFKVERWILGWAVGKPSTDDEALALARGEIDHFSAWTVEGSDANQLLMCDYQSRTRSWLMAVSIDDVGTRLYFGSAVVPLRPNGDTDRAFGTAFHLLLGFHKLYSRALLQAARGNL